MAAAKKAKAAAPRARPRRLQAAVAQASASAISTPLLSANVYFIFAVQARRFRRGAFLLPGIRRPKVRARDPVVPAEAVFVEHAPQISQRERGRRQKRS